MNIVEAVAERSTCDRGKVGAVAVLDKRIIATGYAGSPSGLPHCSEAGHLIHEVVEEDGKISKHCIRTIHAEQNVIVQAAKYGIALKGASLYCTMVPCYVCAKMIVNAGIVRVMAKKRYHADKLTLKLFKESGVKLDILTDELEKYDNQ